MSDEAQAKNDQDPAPIKNTDAERVNKEPKPAQQEEGSEAESGQKSNR